MLVSKKVARVCLCYAHEDEHLLPKLLEHLKALQQQGLIEYWYEGCIQAGEQREKEIYYQINTSDIIVSLISPSYIADYYNQEMKAAIVSHYSRRAIVVPVILRPVYYDDTPFAHLSPLPDSHIPVTCWANHDEAFFEIAEGIRRIAERICHIPSPSDAYFPCNFCKHLLPSESAFCTVCGATIQQREENSLFFSKAGVKRQQTKRVRSRQHDEIKTLYISGRSDSSHLPRELQFPLIECMFPLFERLMRHLLQSVLFLVVGGITLEIIVGRLVSSYFSATTYIPYDAITTARAGATIVAPQENVWPSTASSIILVTNILVTFLILLGALLVHTYCYRIQSKVRVLMIAIHAVFLLLLGLIINPLAILSAAVPSSTFMIGDLAATPICFHFVAGFLTITVMFLSLGISFPHPNQLKAGRRRQTTRPVGDRS